MSDTMFILKSSWWNDGLSPSEVGRRCLAMLEKVGPLTPAMKHWAWIDRTDCEYLNAAEAAPQMTSLVERNVFTDDADDSAPEEGYVMVAKGSKVVSEFGTPDSIFITVWAGSKWAGKAEFDVGGSGQKPDLQLVTYDIYKGALEALASSWPCPWVLAYAYMPEDSLEPWDGDIDALVGKARQAEHFVPRKAAWIGYLSAPLARGLTPPPELTCEWTPGGGMILSSVVGERIDPDNPAHVRRAGLLAAIMNERAGQRLGMSGRAPEMPARVGPY
jgi:hypothetical protein